MIDQGVDDFKNLRDFKKHFCAEKSAFGKGISVTKQYHIWNTFFPLLVLFLIKNFLPIYLFLNFPKTRMLGGNLGITI